VTTPRSARYRHRPPQLDLLRLGCGRPPRRPIYTLIETAKLNDVDPQAWLADVLARLPDHPTKRIDELNRPGFAGGWFD